MLTSELAPFSKVGGLADMVSSLSKEMADCGMDVKVITPLYSSIKGKDTFDVKVPVLSVHMGLGVEKYCRVLSTSLAKAEVNFLEYDEYFDRAGIYNFGDISYTDNGARYAFMCRAALDFCRTQDWIPDVIHCHDWPAAYLPMYLNNNFIREPLGKAASVFTIHNMQHQGTFDKGVIEFAGLPQAVFNSSNCEHFGAFNLMKGAIYNSTKISTVSPTYAKQIETAEYGCGLDSVIRFKSADIVGILNGVDLEEWHPSLDTFIAKNFTKDDLAGKFECKKDLQETMGLAVDADIPVFGVIARLFDQKGLDLFANIARQLLENYNIQIAILGSGDKHLEYQLCEIAKLYPEKMAVEIAYNNKLSHQIEAGADFFVMPSRFEPCGLNQMYSMIYGTLPIVRNTGGLADTVDNYNQAEKTGCGFVFDEASEVALYNTIRWVIDTWYNRREDILILQQNAMSKDFSWSKSSNAYRELYDWAIEERKKAF